MNFFEIETKMNNSINKIEFTNEQEEFITYDGDESSILCSVAGSGKTFSCVHKLKHLINKGVDPKRIIFFSFTNAAVDELKERIGNNNVKICTIHSFCYSVLASMKKYKEMLSIYDFIFWYKKEAMPLDKSKKYEFNREIERMYDDAEKISSDIGVYKLNNIINIKTKLPDYYVPYCKYQKDKNKYDFADLLVQTFKAAKENPIWKKKFVGMYDHVFCDEYQDTSIIQLEILLKLEAKQYYLIGDRHQSIFGFNGSNCMLLESRLKKVRDIKYFNLTSNFRSAKEIVENSNKFSDLVAKYTKTHTGYIGEKFLLYNELKDLIEKEKEIAILVRTNHVIKMIELLLLKDKVKMKYFNYISEKDIENYNNGNVNIKLQNKIYELLPFFGTTENLIGFIESNKESKKFVTSIHKSKGREFETTVLVNSFSPEIITKNDNKFSPDQLRRLTFLPDSKDFEESKNIHYVGVSRAKTNLYYLYFPEDF